MRGGSRRRSGEIAENKRSLCKQHPGRRGKTCLREARRRRWSEGKEVVCIAANLTGSPFFCCSRGSTPQG